MDEFTKFNNQTAGRDKIFRLVQYTSRVIWLNLEKKRSNPLTVEKVKKIDEVLGLMRRLLRFGRFFETIHSAIPVFSSVTNPIIRFTSAMSRISNGCYMFLDHIICLHKLGLWPFDTNIAKWDRLSTKFWLYAILLSIIRDIYEIIKIYKEEYRSKFMFSRNKSIDAINSTLKLHESVALNSEVKKSLEKEKRLGGCLSTLFQFYEKLGFVSRVVFIEHGDVTVDTSKNICDLFIPLSSLGYIRMNPSLVSFLGVMSTILSAIPQLNPMVKMVPAT